MADGSRGALLTAAMLAAVLSAPVGAVQKPAVVTTGPADCDHLIQQFDVAWKSHSAGKRADAAHRARDLGEAACHEGRYADGVHQLKRALHDLGLKPVLRAGAVAAR
jgi:hypothetical protein